VPNFPHTIVIGGGISGLSCAYRLQQLGVPVTLLEESERVGGVIESVEKDGFLFEKGPQSFLATETLLGLIRTLGLEAELLRSDPKAPRYIFLRGRLQAVPMAPAALLTSSLLGTASKFRLITEPLRRSRPPEKEETVADFVRRKFGNEILDYLVAPFTSGVYAGDPEMLSLRSAFPSVAEWEREYGSVLRGAKRSREASGGPRPSLCSFRRGVATLPRALAEKLGAVVRVGVHTEAIERIEQGGKATYEVRISCAGKRECLQTAAVVVATPAYTAGKLLKTFSRTAEERLDSLAYAPVAFVGNGYHRRQVGNPLHGFGFLIPRKEGLRTLGTVWNSSLFPGRAPDGMVVLSSFAGGATDARLVHMADQAIADIVEREIARILQIEGRPAVTVVWRYPRALPQYQLGHAERLATIREELARFPGILLAGNYLEGPAIGNCVEQAFKTAEAVRDHLTSAVGTRN
jgi:oxygen-dependent protoporphyrinogen oxidase